MVGHSIRLYMDIPTVDFSNYGNEYNSALLGLVGIVTEGDAIYNYDKQGNPLALGAPVKRDYGWKESEVYLQDSWQALKNLTHHLRPSLRVSTGSGGEDGNSGWGVHDFRAPRAFLIR